MILLWSVRPVVILIYWTKEIFTYVKNVGIGLSEVNVLRLNSRLAFYQKIQTRKKTNGQT